MRGPAAPLLARTRAARRRRDDRHPEVRRDAASSSTCRPPASGRTALGVRRRRRCWQGDIAQACDRKMPHRPLAATVSRGEGLRIGSRESPTCEGRVRGNCQFEEAQCPGTRRQPLRQHDLQPLRPLRPEAAGDLARPVAQFRRRHAARDQARHRAARPSTSASPISTSPTITARRPARPRRPSARSCARDFAGLSRRADHLDQGRLRHVARPLWRVGQPQIPARQPRPEPEADGARLCRHLLFAPLRPRHAARGDDGRARPRRALRARRSMSASPPTIRSARARPPTILQRARHALPHPPAELFDAQPLGRGRRPARHAGRARHRLDRLLAAGAGHADRQISRAAFPKAAAPRRASRCARPSSTTRTSPTSGR